MIRYIIISFFLFIACSAWGQQVKVYPGSEAAKHVNETIYVADTVKGYQIINPHFKVLDLGAKYPKQKFTVVLESDEIKFSPSKLIGHLVIVHGTVELYKNKPRVVVKDTSDIKIQKTPTD